MSGPLFPQVKLELSTDTPSDELLETVAKALEEAGASKEAVDKFVFEATSSDWVHFVAAIDKHAAVEWKEAEEDKEPEEEWWPDEEELSEEYDDDDDDED